MWKGAYGALTRSWNVPSRARVPFSDMQAPYMGRERCHPGRLRPIVRARFVGRGRRAQNKRSIPLES